MCGICGVVSVKGSRPKVDMRTVEAMTASMLHRGPDRGGVWNAQDGLVGLGHRRLSIIDLSPLGAQPMSNADGSIWITYNGEVYNYRELRLELEQKGHRFKSQSDTEVIVHLYEEYGEAMVDRLDGDFAFGIWDGRFKSLFLARDPIGVKPLYFGWAGPYFVFASELKALLKVPEVSAEIDKEALHHYLTYLAVPAPFSMIKGIQKLRAGETLRLSESGTVTLRKYWEPLPPQRNVLSSDPDEQLRDLLAKSVRKRMVGDVPVGLMFSGGVDSSLNALLFKQASAPQQVHTYNLWMDEPNYHNERGIAEQVATCIGTVHHAQRFDVQQMMDGVVGSDALMFYQDEPLADPAALSVYMVTKLARQHGHVVLQAGEGADELFCGYDGYRAWLRRERDYWRWIARLPRSFSYLGYFGLDLVDHPFGNKMADVLRRRSRGQEFFLSEAVGYYENEKRRILSDSFLNDAGTRDFDSFSLVAPYYERVRAQIKSPSFLQVMSYIELSLRLPELLLMRADKMSMANSVELRVPFLDRELIEFALSVSESFKLRDGVSKEPLKRLASRELEGMLMAPVPAEFGGSPKKLFYRGKTGFGAPIEDWFMRHLSEDLTQLIQAHKNDWEEYFDLDEIRRMLSRGMVGANRSYQLWALYSFMKWKVHFGV